LNRCCSSSNSKIVGGVVHHDKTRRGSYRKNYLYVPTYATVRRRTGKQGGIQSLRNKTCRGRTHRRLRPRKGPWGKKFFEKIKEKNSSGLFWSDNIGKHNEKGPPVSRGKKGKALPKKGGGLEHLRGGKTGMLRQAERGVGNQARGPASEEKSLAEGVKFRGLQTFESGLHNATGCDRPRKDRRTGGTGQSGKAFSRDSGGKNEGRKSRCARDRPA